jgi:hypothetical protein
MNFAISSTHLAVCSSCTNWLNFRLRSRVSMNLRPEVSWCMLAMLRPQASASQPGSTLIMNESVDLERPIVRARLILSLLAMFFLYVDPSQGGLFHLGGWLLAVLACHFVYSSSMFLALAWHVESRRVRQLSTALDLIFATVIASLTEGRTSPAFVFFVFTIVAVGFRTGFRDTIVITSCCVAAYLLVVGISVGSVNIYMMRAVYLAIAGYLIGFFGQQRVDFASRLRALEAAAERETIATFTTAISRR